MTEVVNTEQEATPLILDGNQHEINRKVESGHKLATAANWILEAAKSLDVSLTMEEVVMLMRTNHINPDKYIREKLVAGKPAKLAGFPVSLDKLAEMLDINTSNFAAAVANGIKQRIHLVNYSHIQPSQLALEDGEIVFPQSEVDKIVRTYSAVFESERELEAYNHAKRITDDLEAFTERFGVRLVANDHQQILRQPMGYGETETVKLDTHKLMRAISR